MKIHQQTPAFAPVVITLETQEEVNSLATLVGASPGTEFTMKLFKELLKYTTCIPVDCKRLDLTLPAALTEEQAKTLANSLDEFVGPISEWFRDTGPTGFLAAFSKATGIKREATK